MKATALEFGFKDEKIEAPALWGARLIMDRRNGYESVDLLWDRQSLAGDQDAAKEVLKKALDGEPKGSGAIRAFLDWLTREFKADRIGVQERVVFDKTLKSVRFRGSPNGSHGYFYVTASFEALDTCDGCGTGGLHGSKTYPGLCQKCRDERTQEKRQAKARVERARW